MKLTNAEIRNQAESCACELLERARACEPQITEDLQKIALEVEAEMIGLEHKFKTQDSLTEKLTGQIKADLKNLLNTGISEMEIFENAVSLRTKQNNDALRYTFVFSIERYVFGFKKTLTVLTENNYQVPKKRIWNAWKNIGTNFDGGYRGINITVISSQGQKFELQFHTAESFALKTATHKLYKLMKSNTITLSQKDEIKRKSVKSAEAVRVPKGVKKL